MQGDLNLLSHRKVYHLTRRKCVFYFMVSFNLLWSFQNFQIFFFTEEYFLSSNFNCPTNKSLFSTWKPSWHYCSSSLFLCHKKFYSSHFKGKQIVIFISLFTPQISLTKPKKLNKQNLNQNPNAVVVFVTNKNTTK